MTDEEASTVLRVARQCGECYTRDAKPDQAYSPEVVATACSNTGYFILSTLGYSHDDIKRLADLP